ncbi:MAG: tryptophan--tRNA ligase [Candidatus Dojkabacteria bacterium]
MKQFFTGIKPTGSPHIGNYIGMIHNAKVQAEGNKAFFGVVDLHAITVDWEPEELKKLSREIVAFYLASDFDLDHAHFFMQSENPDHPYLGWLLNCVTSMGRLGNMIQYKEKSQDKGAEYASVGLFDYPVLMAADILLYDSDIVPVGEDQVQHVELTRDIAKKFNNMFGETFTLPQAVVNTYGSRVKSLQHPEKKMSKSDRDNGGCIFLLDEPEVAAKKIMRSVTDSAGTIEYDPGNRPGISNLLDIYSVFSGEPIEALVEKYRGKGYGDFKRDLAEVMKSFLTGFQKRYNAVISDQAAIDRILQDGHAAAKQISGKKLEEVKNKMGFA